MHFVQVYLLIMKEHFKLIALIILADFYDCIHGRAKRGDCLWVITTSHNVCIALRHAQLGKLI